MDVSKADYMIGVDMARKGFSPDQIGGVIEQASPELPTRKAGHEADYVARTVKAVFTHPEVVKHQQEQAREGQRAQHGHVTVRGPAPNESQAAPAQDGRGCPLYRRHP